MANLWPWLAVAGMGALHGLNPATGWMLAAAWGVRSHGRTPMQRRARALRALLPIAAGHAASVALVAAAVVFGLALDRRLLLAVAGGLLVVAVLLHLSGHAPRMARAPAGHAGLALWSFLVSTTHGTGLVLVPALMPLCLGAGTGSGAAAATRVGTASDALLLALAAVAVHTAAMLAVTGLVACGMCRGLDAGARWLRR
ncbi:MAG: hypothetical protein V4505_22185 [Pseudomonadota bacterium]